MLDEGLSQYSQYLSDVIVLHLALTRVLISSLSDSLPTMSSLTLVHPMCHPTHDMVCPSSFALNRRELHCN